MAKSLSKELKQPDEFVSFWTHLGAAISKHRQKVIALMGTIGAVGLLGWGGTAYRHSQAGKATAAFARIDRVASAALLPEKAPEKTEAGKAKTEDNKADDKTEDDNLPHFKTEKERLEAALKEADNFVAAFGSTGIGRKALFGKAGRLLALDRAAEAAALYETLLASETDPDLKAIEQEGIAAASEAAGKLDDALRAYSALADGGQRNGSFYVDRALFAKARILEKQGKAKDAEKALREILEKAPKTSLRQQIDDRLAILAEK